MADNNDIYIDNITDEDKDNAQNAYIEFKKKNYNSCLQYLHKLEYRTHDFKVPLNKAIVEFCKSDCRKTKELSESLSSLCNEFQIRLERLNDVNYCVVHYNQVVLLFHKREFSHAMTNIERIYKLIEPMNDVLARKVSLLAIELQLTLKMPDKALSLIQYFENHLLNSTILPNEGNESNSKETETMDVDPLIDSMKKKLAKYKARCYLMKKHLSAAVKEIELLSTNSHLVNHLFLKANLQYLSAKYEDALKTLSSIPADCLNFREDGESWFIMYNNNIGVIQYAMGKPNIASYYYQQALKADLKMHPELKEENQLMYIPSSTRYYELCYNLGITLLYGGRYHDAFECLIVALMRYHKNYRLWLRIAECCIKIHKPTNSIDFGVGRKPKRLISKIVHNKILFCSKLSVDKIYSAESQSCAIPVPSMEFASICLRNAEFLVPTDTQTAPVPLFFIPGVTPSAPTPSSGVAPSSPLQADDLVILKNTIFVNSAYVSICLGDYIVGLYHARQILVQPRISPTHKLLGHMYAAECLISLDNISEALEHLDPHIIKELSLELNPDPENEDDNVKETRTNPPTKWFPTNVKTAHAVLNYNIAVAKTLTGQFDKAAKILNDLLKNDARDCQLPAHVAMLIIYIELQLGHRENAVKYLKQYNARFRG